jgi:hypothetical protein
MEIASATLQFDRCQNRKGRIDHGNEKGCKEARKEGRKESRKEEVVSIQPRLKHAGDAKAPPKVFCSD